MTNTRVTRISFAFLLMAALFVGSEKPASGQTLIWKVERSSVVLLVHPVVNSPAVTTVRIGATLRLLERNGEWLHVIIANASGAQPAGWVRSQALHAAIAPPAAVNKTAASTKAPAKAPTKVGSLAKAPPTSASMAAARTAAASLATQRSVVRPIVEARPLPEPVSYAVPAPEQFGQGAPFLPLPPPAPPRIHPTPRSPIPRPGSTWRLMGTGAMTQQGGNVMAYGGQMSVRLARWFEVVAEGGQLTDVMPSSTRLEIASTAAVLSQIGNEPVLVDARAPAMFGMLGGRLISPGPAFFRPYFAASGGLAMVHPQVKFLRDGEPLTAIAGSAFQNKTNDTLLGISAGVLIPFGKVFAIDVGYRVVRGFDRSGPSFQVNQAVFGLGTRF